MQRGKCKKTVQLIFINDYTNYYLKRYKLLNKKLLEWIQTWLWVNSLG